jgi:hypothetical protein
MELYQAYDYSSNLGGEAVNLVFQFRWGEFHLTHYPIMRGTLVDGGGKLGRNSQNDDIKITHSIENEVQL